VSGKTVWKGTDELGEVGGAYPGATRQSKIALTRAAVADGEAVALATAASTQLALRSVICI
jgi:hypothetical protein